MYDLIDSAINNERSEKFTFFLDGDLCQMASQRNFLNSRGIETRQNNVYPCLRWDDVEKALSLIWRNNVEGWWHYKELYVKYNICSEEEFREKLMRD